MAKTNFILGPNFKKFHFHTGPFFPRILEPLATFNAVLRAEYMACSLEKNTSANLSFGFLFTLGDPPPLVWQTPLFPDFFPATFPYHLNFLLVSALVIPRM